ncbi:Penicillin-binding protein [Pseudomonas sp. IT-196MI5]
MYVDAQGNRVFTDHPKPGDARRVPLTTINRIAASPAGATPLIAQNSPETQVLFHYEVLRILAPEPDATVRSNTGEVTVSATNEPALHPGHRYRLLLDGQPTAEPGLGPVFALSNIDRGSHTLSVEILDEQGRIVERTASQPFHMQRTSLAQKRRIKPCTLENYGQRPECPLNNKPVEEKNPFLRLF